MALGLTYATSHTLVRMRLASFRHALKDQNRLSWIVGGGFVGLVLAGGTIWIAARGDSDALVVALAVWMLGWIIGPMFSGGGDETLKPEYFSMLPLPPRTLAAGLLTAAVAGVAPIISLIALLSLVVVGAQLSVAATLIAVPALLLQLFCFILASRLAVAVYGVLLQVRSGAVLAALVNAFILAFAAQGWALIVASCPPMCRARWREVLALRRPAGVWWPWRQQGTTTGSKRCWPLPVCCYSVQ